MSSRRRSDPALVPVALTIAGSDSGGGAGIQADLKTFAAHQVFGLSAITAVTAQSTTEVRAVHPVPPAMVRAQVETLLADFRIAAVKTGMLGSAELIRTVADLLDRIDAPAVIDPVMIASSGAPLAEAGAIEATIALLLPRARLITPNLPEVEAILGERPRSQADMIAAARALVDRGARAALVKGGHLEADDLVDVLFTEGEAHIYSGPRMHTASTHGSGCTYAAAITAHLARGVPLTEAVRESHAWLRDAIATAPGLGRGAGPLHHFHRWYRW